MGKWYGMIETAKLPNQKYKPDYVRKNRQLERIRIRQMPSGADNCRPRTVAQDWSASARTKTWMCGDARGTVGPSAAETRSGELLGRYADALATDQPGRQGGNLRVLVPGSR